MPDKERTGREDMQRRMKEAQQLLGDILTDKPELPPELPARERSPRRKSSKSPPRERTLFKSTPVRDPSPRVSSRRPVYRQPSPKRQQTVRISTEVQEREYDDMLEDDEEIIHNQFLKTPVRRAVSSKMPMRRAVSPKTPGRQVPRLKLMDSDDFLQNTGETTGKNLYKLMKLVKCENCCMKSLKSLC